MLRKLSIRTKITLWFSLALIVIAGVTAVIVVSVTNQVIQKTIKDNLIETVENNIDEIEFYQSIDGSMNEVDIYMKYKNGFLEIDDDFLKVVNEVYTSLYLPNNSLLYGENPIANDLKELPFSNSKIQTLEINGVTYYVFDRELTAQGLEGLWLRGIVSEEQGDVQVYSIIQTTLIIMPILIIITIVGGYLLAGRMLSPIREISKSANEISRGGDLKKRIEVGNGSDELHQLANNFNDMFERLDKSFETEKQFTSDASHELRTPMAVILAQCEYTLGKENTTDEYIESLETIERQGKKMSSLIDDMLSFTRLEQKADRYKLTEVDLSNIVNSVCSEMKLIKDKNITLDFNIEPNIICMGNVELLERLLINVIGNAFRYGKENGHIFVELKDIDNTINMSIKDDGIGISEDDQQKIFERFYQVNSSRSGEGTGLGLSMVKEICKIHNFNINLNSKIGVESEFTFSFEKN